MAQIILGIELDSRKIRLALVRADKKIRVLDAVALVAPDGCIADGEIVFADGIISVIKEYINKAPIKPDSLAISLNSPNVITRKLSMPKMSAQETSAAVEFEMLKVFPSIKESHAIVHRVTGVSAGGGDADRKGTRNANSDVLAHKIAGEVERVNVGAGTGSKADTGTTIAGTGSKADTGTIARTDDGSRAGANAGVSSGASDALRAESRTGKGVGTGAGTGAGVESEVCVFIAMCPNVLIKSCRELSEGIGIPLKYLDIKPNTMTKAAFGFLGLDRTAAGLIVDAGYKMSTINVVINGNVIISRCAPSGVSAIDSFIADVVGLPQDEVERARTSGDFSIISADEREVTSYIAAGLNDISEQMRQIINFIEYDMPGIKLEFITITGDGYGLPGIGEYLSTLLNLKYIPPTPAPDVSGYEDFISVSSAFGAALREDKRGGDINYVAEDAQAGRRGGRVVLSKGVIALTAAVAVFAIAILITAFFYFKSISDQKTIENIIQNINSNAWAAKLEGDIETAKIELAQSQALIEEIENSGVQLSESLISLSERAPDDLFVSNLSVVNKNEIVLTGKSKAFGGVSWFALKLRESGEFESVRINSVVSNSTSAGDVIDYTFSLTLTMRA
ncbi:MAG: PilN domain-containing protein [Oscillospiraceae bacterium]|nr:PilN domain-containing protein [Oscillospiraceae bacterium]